MLQLWTLSPQNASVLCKQPCTPSKETTSYPCSNNKLTASSSSASSCSIVSSPVRIHEVVSSTRSLCFALRPTAWTLWHDLQLKQSISAERKREASHKNSSQLPFTWSMAIYCIFFGIFIFATCYQTNSSAQHKESCNGYVKMLYLPYTAKVNSTLFCLKNIQALFR